MLDAPRDDVILFVLVRVVPADPAVSIAGPKADPETLAAIRKDLGLDDPLPVQYGRYSGSWRTATSGAPI